MDGVKPRTDAMPENHYYQDGGCNLAPSCLRCPFEYCQYDMPGGSSRMAKIARTNQIRALRDEGKSAAEIAGIVGCGVRMVNRRLKGAG